MTAIGVTDVCLVTEDLESAISFYIDKLGLELAHHMPGFADFSGPGVTLAVWDASAIRSATTVPARVAELGGHDVMLAVRLDSPHAVDAMYERLARRGIEFYDPPRDYPWTARAIYCAGPCGEFWEFYAWLEGGEPGSVGTQGE